MEMKQRYHPALQRAARSTFATVRGGQKGGSSHSNNNSSSMTKKWRFSTLIRQRTCNAIRYGY